MDFISQIVKFNAQTAGRDKICRLIQYGSRALWGALNQLEQFSILAATHKTTIDKCKDIEYFIGNVRKLLRFGKSLELLLGALRNVHVKDEFLRFTLVVGKINQSIYLLVDHLILIGRLRLAQVDLHKWGEVSARFWLASLILNLSRDFYDIISLVSGSDGGSNRPGSPRGDLRLGKALAHHEALVADTVKNMCDICLPLTTLGKINLRPYTIGLLGVISSLVGIVQLVNPDYKLNPS